MPVTDADIVNQALFMMSDKVPPVTGTAPTFDDSVAGKAAARLYAPAVATIARSYEWDMARREIALTLSGNPTPALSFAFEYLYPANGIEIWQVRAPVVDKFNPVPVNYTVGNTLIGSTQKKVIWTDVAGALGIYNNNPTPDVWDAGFREAVVRLLASEFATALAGRIETSTALLETSGGMRNMAQGRDA